MAEDVRGTKMPPDEHEGAGLKLNNLKTKTIASSPITSQQIEEEKMEAMTDFLFLDSKITMEC